MNRFVWLRGFPDMASRAGQLERFYGGPIWKRHRDAANATMVDSDNVLLLRPARSDSGFHLENLKRPALGTNEASKSLIVATIYYLTSSADSFAEFFETEIVPVLRKSRVSIFGTFVTENRPNTFPALPVREGENVFVSFSAFANREAHQRRASSFADPAAQNNLR